MNSVPTSGSETSFLTGGGEMAERIGAYPWTTTPLGPLGKWPQGLRTAVSLMLNSQHPMWIGWGHDATFLYNDAYVQVLSLAKHPWALGKPAALVWAEIWDFCGPLADKVFQKGEASFVDDVRLFMRRGEFLEETFYSFSYSPIRDDSGAVAGLFCPSAEVTAKVLHTRRLRTLSELAAKALIEKSAESACASAAATLSRNPDDVPFAMLYLIDREHKVAQLQQGVGVESGIAGISPLTISLSGPVDEAPWCIPQAVDRSQPLVMVVPESAGLPLGPARQPVAQALVLPVTSRGQERPLGILVAAVNPTRKLDADYRTFYELIAGQIASAIQNARAAEEEKRRADMLLELDRAKTAFFSNVSHEFRTPLTLMLSPVEELLARSHTDLTPAAKKQLEMVNRNGYRLLRLVNSLLDFSRIEAGRVQACFEATDLATFTADLASVFRAATERAGLTLTVDCPRLSQLVYVDRDMWEKIVLNLLSNAFKFTFDGGIFVSIRETNSQAELQVRDTGVGIAAEEMPRLFERFHRIETTRSRTHEGSGIGLALIQELVKLHGGTVRAESGVGQGTSFFVSIPLGTGHLPSDQVDRPRASTSTAMGAAPFVEEALRWLPEELPSESAIDKTTSATLLPFPCPQPEGSSLEKRPRVIIADDNADMRQYLARLLSERYDVVAVPDGVAALAEAQERRPDLVLSDVMMPHLDGFGLLKELRTHPTTRTLPVILLSARAGEESRVEGLSQGADDYLVKPFAARELLARVESHLTLARVRQENEQRVTQILDNITDGFQLINREGHLHQLNSAARRIFSIEGLNPDAMIGRHYFDEVFPDALQNEGGKALARTLQQREPTFVEYFYRPWRRWFLVRHYPTSDGGAASFFQDITDRKQAEEALRDREFRLRQLADSMPQIVWAARPDGQIDYLNRKWSDRARDEANEAGDGGWTSALHPDDLLEYRQAWAASVATGEAFELEYRLRLPANAEYRWHLGRALPIRDEAGKIERWFGTSTDMHEQKTAAEHLERVVEERTAKLRESILELEAFSYSISHDMRAPLRAMQGYADALLKDYQQSLDGTAIHYLERMRRAAYRLDMLIQDVLSYSKVAKGDVTLKPVDVTTVIKDVVQNYHHLQPPDAHVVLETSIPPVMGHEAHLTQIVSNLLGNAVKFVAPGVVPRIRISAIQENDLVRVLFEDNGIGIEPRHHAEIFKIFGRVYSEKQFEGTGIGLAIVKKAAERMGGSVSVASQLGKGSTFCLSLRPMT